MANRRSHRPDAPLYMEDDYEEYDEPVDEGYADDLLVDPPPRRYAQAVRGSVHRQRPGPYIQNGSVPPRQKKKANNAKKITEWNAFRAQRGPELRAKHKEWNYSTLQKQLSDEFQAAKAQRESKAKSIKSFEQLALFISDLEGNMNTIKSEISNYSKLYDTSLAALSGVKVAEKVVQIGPAVEVKDEGDDDDDEKSDDDAPTIPATQPEPVVAPPGGKGLPTTGGKAPRHLLATATT